MASTRSTGSQKELSGGLPAFEILHTVSIQQRPQLRGKGSYLVSGSRLFQRVDLMDLDLQLARLQQSKELIDVELELIAGFDVAKERGTGDFDALGNEFPVHRR